MLLEAMMLCLYGALAYVRLVTYPIRALMGYRY